MGGNKVAILGGGVAGMSAAHELIKRKFEVHVYERNKIYCGGKARSVNVPDTNLQDKDKYLPGEHGFRFFPGFYKHVTATMKEIPFYKNGKAQKNGCFGNLTPTNRIMIARYGKNPIVSIARFPRSLADFKLIIGDLHGSDSGLTKIEEETFAHKIWQLMTSSYERRNNDYERIGWWDYLEADKFGPSYKSLLVNGLTRTLVAARAQTASTKTGGNIFLQLIFNMMSPGANTDRVLNAPTNDAWLDPWLEFLKKSGVEYNFNHTVEKIHFDGEKITGADVRNEKGEIVKIEADYFILATPIEHAAPLINHKKILNSAPSTQGMSELAKMTSWMNGIQYYLNEDVKITDGHCIYSDSEWAITSISQIQFWNNYDLKERYNGKVKGVLSVDVSDWIYTKYKGKCADDYEPDEYTKYKGKCADDYEPDEVADLVWEQMENSLNIGGQKVLDKSMREFHYVDRDIRWDKKARENVELEPLLVNEVKTWDLRPEAYNAIPNLFMASDYVRTFTDLATMEGANEAARRAVNALLEDTKSNKPKCELWPLEEPWFFKPLRNWDKKRFKKGLPYSNKPPMTLRIFMFIWGGLYLTQLFIKTILFYISNLFSKK